MHITINCSECFEIWCSALWQGSCYKCLHQCLRRFFVYKVSDEFPDKRSLIRLKVYGLVMPKLFEYYDAYGHRNELYLMV